MGSSVSYTSGQLSQIDDLREYITEYCNQEGIDPNSYLSTLDGSLGEADLLNDPAFQAYWQLAYLQLVYIISGGSPEISASGEVVYDEDALMASYNSASEDIKGLATTMLEDDPQLMAFFTLQTDGTTTSTNLLADINLATATATATTTNTETDSEESANEQYVSEDARDFVAEYGSSPGLDWLIDYEEGVRSAEGSILNYLAEMDQQLVELTEALNGGTMTAEQYEAELEGISTYRETMLAMLQQLESSMSTVMELFSKMIEQVTEMSQAVTSNMRPV